MLKTCPYNCSELMSCRCPYTVIPAPLYRHSGESRNPGTLALLNDATYSALLDSGFRRNDGFGGNAGMG